jgi:hypothetical protein
VASDTSPISIELTGPVKLVNDQQISVLHDDGVALKIDGIPVAGFNSYRTPPRQESTRFAGSSGVRSLDLLCANATDGGSDNGAWLLFFSSTLSEQIKNWIARKIDQFNCLWSAPWLERICGCDCTLGKQSTG